MNDTTQKLWLGIIAISMASIAIQLSPISRQASSWNKCLETTTNFLSRIHNIEGKGKVAKQAVAVNICNGAVHYNQIK